MNLADSELATTDTVDDSFVITDTGLQIIEIPLSKTGKYAGMYTAIVSPEDADLADLNWYVTLMSSSLRYVMRKVKQKHVMLHRAIMERIIGRAIQSHEVIDHINGDGLDNRRENLRLASNSQNNANKEMNIKNTSGYKGVSWSKQNQKWRAGIKHNYKSKNLGYFETPEEAHKAYCEAADKYHGEFANFGDSTK